MKSTILYLTIFFGIVLSQCHSPQKESTNEPLYLTLTDKQLASMDISLASTQQQSIQPVVFATGKVALLPNSEAIISSNIAGKIERIHVIEGDVVKQGQPLLTISSMQLIELQQSYLTAKNNMDLYKQEFERQQILRKDDIASLADFQETETKYLNAKNTEESLREKLNLLGMDMRALHSKERANVINQLQIKSPINGSVFKINVTPGMSIETNTNLMNILNLQRLYADVDIYENDLDQIAEGQSVELTFINKNAAKTKGTVRKVISSIDPNSRAVKVHVDFTTLPHAIVLPEMAVKVKIVGIRSTEKKTTVPTAALLQEGELYYLYYAIPQNGAYEFHKSKVSVGETDGYSTEITVATPLPKAALIVQKNVYLIDAESKKSAN